MIDATAAQWRRVVPRSLREQRVSPHHSCTHASKQALAHHLAWGTCPAQSHSSTQVPAGFSLGAQVSFWIPPNFVVLFRKNPPKFLESWPLSFLRAGPPKSRKKAGESRTHPNLETNFAKLRSGPNPTSAGGSFPPSRAGGFLRRERPVVEERRRARAACDLEGNRAGLGCLEHLGNHFIVRSGHGVACPSVSTSPLSVTTSSLSSIGGWPIQPVRVCVGSK